MRTLTKSFLSLSEVATRRCAFVALVVGVAGGSAFAQTREELTVPTSTVEIGGLGVTDGAFKAGEFNGLQKKGGLLIGNFDVAGGGRLGSDDARRYRIKATDLGLASRALTAQITRQGKFGVVFGYDQLRRNRSDSYQTPYDGAGTNVLSLPASWLVPSVAASGGGNSTSAQGLAPSIGTAPYLDVVTTSPTRGTFVTPSAAQTDLVNAAAAADVALFHPFDVFTTRTRYKAAVNVDLNQAWAVDASFRPEHKEGTKPMGTVSRNVGGDRSTIIPDRIDTNTDQVNLNVNFKGAKSFAQAGYYGSFFSNNVPFMSWQNWASGPSAGLAGVLNQMSSAPSNNFNQVNGSGGINMTRTTKLVVNGSYARNTQNDLFLTEDPSTGLLTSTIPVVPVNSLNGLVVSTQFSSRFTSRPTKKVNVSALYKFDNRDNRTAVNIYQFADAGEPLGANANFPAAANNPFGAVIAGNANANRSYSRKANLFNADVDYTVVTGQHLKAGYAFQRINRACPNSWIDCADAAVNNENTVHAEWRVNLGARLTSRLAYEYGQRRTPEYNENAFLAIVPYANVSPASAADGATALSFMIANGWNGWGPALGYTATSGNQNLFFPSNNALANATYANANRISELPGMRRYYVADRNRSKVRTMLTWQADNGFALSGGSDYNNDEYPDATYGLQRSKTWSANIDGSYAVTKQVSVDLFYGFETLASGAAGNTYTANNNTANVNGFTALAGNSCNTYTSLQQRNNNNKLDPCLNWSTDMTDRVHTVGASLNGKAGKFTTLANFIMTRARTDNDVSGGNYANNPLALPGAAAGTVAAFFIPATALPTATTDTAEVRFNTTYALTKAQSLRVLYSYLHMTSVDWMYDGMQMGSGTPGGVLPTLEQPFNFNVNVIGMSYVVSF